jgi:hypothetical protein
MLLQQALDKTLGLPLTKTTRNELVQYFHFGSAHYTTPQGLVLDVGAFTLAVNCPWQLQLSDDESIKHNEVFIRKREPGLPSPSFDWKVPGSNLRDQRLHELVNQTNALVPNRSQLLDNQSFIIYFENKAQLIVSPDATREQEYYWQFFSNTGDEFTITLGPQGIL